MFTCIAFSVSNTFTLVHPGAGGGGIQLQQMSRQVRRSDQLKLVCVHLEKHLFHIRCIRCSISAIMRARLIASPQPSLCLYRGQPCAHSLHHNRQFSNNLTIMTNLKTAGTTCLYPCCCRHSRIRTNSQHGSPSRWNISRPQVHAQTPPLWQEGGAAVSVDVVCSAAHRSQLDGETGSSSNGGCSTLYMLSPRGSLRETLAGYSGQDPPPSPADPHRGRGRADGGRY